MKSERIYLYEGNSKVYFDTYISDISHEYAVSERPAVLVIPGGGYGGCSDREAEPIARAYMAHGYNCFVLRYSVGEYASKSMPEASQPLLDVSLTMSIIRERSEEFNIIKDKIAVIGFSAGGHLAASLGTMWDDKSIYEKIDIAPGSNKPNAMILCYPVITFKEYTHEGTRDNLLGKYNKDEKLIEKYSLENQVSDKTVPTFIWHTVTDKSVPVVNSIAFSEQLYMKQIPFEMHIFPHGWHGMSLATKEVGCEDSLISKWLGLSVEWLNNTL